VPRSGILPSDATLTMCASVSAREMRAEKVTSALITPPTLIVLIPVPSAEGGCSINPRMRSRRCDQYLHRANTHVRFPILPRPKAPIREVELDGMHRDAGVADEGNGSSSLILGGGSEGTFMPSSAALDDAIVRYRCCRR